MRAGTGPVGMRRISLVVLVAAFVVNGCGGPSDAERRAVEEPAERVQRVLVGGGQERARRPGIAQAAPHQHLRQHAGHAQLAREPVRGGELVGLERQACVGMDHRASLRRAPDGTAAAEDF